MIAAAFTKRESILLLIVFLLGLFLILRTLETAKVCRRIEILRKTHGSAPLKADSFLFDPKLLDELNAMIDYLNRERSRLYHREEDVKAMVTGISHDFRTPLTSISGYVQVLREEGPELPEEERRRYQNIIESRADSLAALAEDFYTFSSLDSLDLTARPVKS